MKGSFNLPKRVDEVNFEILIPRFFKTRNLGMLLLTSILLITAPLWTFLFANAALTLMIMYDFYEIGKAIGTLRLVNKLQKVRIEEIIEDIAEIVQDTPKKEKKKVEKQ